MNGKNDFFRNDVPASGHIPDGSVSFFGDPDAAALDFSASRGNNVRQENAGDPPLTGRLTADGKDPARYRGMRRHGRQS